MIVYHRKGERQIERRVDAALRKEQGFRPLAAVSGKKRRRHTEATKPQPKKQQQKKK